MNERTDEFKIEREYKKVWDTFRTKRIEYLYNKTKDIINILQNNTLNIGSTYFKILGEN